MAKASIYPVAQQWLKNILMVSMLLALAGCERPFPRDKFPPFPPITEVAPREATPRVIAPQEVAPQESAPREIAPQESAPREVAPQESVPEVAAPREIAPQESVPQVAAPEVTAPELPPDTLAGALPESGRTAEAISLEDALFADTATPRPPPPKARGVWRAAMLLPHGGRGVDAAREILYGAELAMFTLAPGGFDIVFIDTSRGMEEAVEILDQSDADVILGPLFARDTEVLKKRRRRVPVISFSNDLRVAGRGIYLFGQTPEQEIRTALAVALKGKPEPAIAILAAASDYGNRVATAAEGLLAENGLAADFRMTFNKEVMADEARLSLVIAGMAEAAESRPFDIIVIAGETAFSLGIAPVLAWHDFDSGKITFVGTSLWGRAAIAQEPSLAGGLYADTPESRKEGFLRLARNSGDGRQVGRFAPLGFDAVSLALALSPAQTGPSAGRRNAARILQAGEGFAGFSGLFRFNRDGSNMRLLDVYTVRPGGGRVVAPAPAGF